MLKKIKFSVRDSLGQMPVLIPLLATRSSWEHVQVRRDSVICIEGYPRSANTYSVAAFTIANENAGHVARHSHLAGQVIRAIRWEIPTLVLMRKPDDAILSLKIREPKLDWGQLIHSYIRFYRVLMPYRDRLCVGRFEEVVKNFDLVMARVNEKFGCDFKMPEPGNAGEQAAFEEVQAMFEDYQRRMGFKAELKEEKIAKPSAEREKVKDRLRGELESEEFASLMRQAEKTYGEFLAYWD